jgi:hypothetical protein
MPSRALGRLLAVLLGASPVASVRYEGAAAGSPTERLIRDGYAVFDGVLPDETVAAVRRSAERLRSNGMMRNLGQEGRDDDVLVIDPGQVGDMDTYGTIHEAAKILASLPMMLVSSGEQEQCSAEARMQFASTVPPRLYMLARYPDSAGRYVAHLDNDPDDPAHLDGPVGLRAADRTFTCILYVRATRCARCRLPTRSVP